MAKLALPLVAILTLVSCSDSTATSGGGAPSTGGAPQTSTTSTTTVGGAGGGGGGELGCVGILSVNGEPGNLHGSLCISCLEDKCCGALAACGADALCTSCLEDITQPGCETNAAALDLATCAIDECEGGGCLCITCACTEDGVCDLPGHDRCDCGDCADFEGCNDGCNFDGVCDDTDACTCPDCYRLCEGQCNGDGFCDEYNESCTCVDCTDSPACAEGTGGQGGG